MSGGRPSAHTLFGGKTVLLVGVFNKEDDMAEKQETPKRAYPKCIPEETREYLREARAEIRRSYEAFFPPEFIASHRAAHRAMLMAARSMIDSALERYAE